MAEESGSKDGYSVAVGADVDEASFQKANRNVSGLEGNLKQLSKVDFSALTGSIKAIAAGLAGVGVFTVKTNFDEVQNMLKAAKAGLTNDAFKRWSTVELQLGLNKGALTKDLASIYEQVAKIRTKGDLNKDQFLSLGLTGASAEAFLKEDDMTKRVMMVMDLALKSDRPLNETASLLSGGLGESFGDLFYLLKLSGKSFDELFQKVTVFTDAASQTNALDFNVELQTARKNIAEMSALLGSSIGEILTPFLEKFNIWVKKYKEVLTDILTFSDDWVAKLGRLVTGKISDPYKDPSIVSRREYGSAGVTTSERANAKLSQAEIDKQLAIVRKVLDITGRGGIATQRDIPGYRATGQDVALGLDKQPWTFKANPLGSVAFPKTPAEQAAMALSSQRLIDIEMAKRTYNDVFQALIVGGTREGLSGFGSGMDFTNTGTLTQASIVGANISMDQATIEAMDKFFSTASSTDINDFTKFLKEAAGRAVKTKGESGLEEGYYNDKKMLLDTDYKLIDSFIKQWIGAKETSMAPVQQTNSITLSFPGVNTQEQGEEVGRGLMQGLGQKLSRSFEMSDLAVGSWS